MNAIWLPLRAGLRSNWRAFLGLAIVAGLAAGIVLAATAGARRTGSTYARYHANERGTDVYLGYVLPHDPSEARNLRLIERLPQVSVATRTLLISFDVIGRHGDSNSALEVSLDANNLRTIDRPRLLAGRMPRAAGEAVADERTFQRLGLQLGAPFLVRVPLGPEMKLGSPLRLRIVGVRPNPFAKSLIGFLSVTNAFYRAHGGRALEQAAFNDGGKVRLRHGAADLAAYQSEVERLTSAFPDAFIPAGVVSGEVGSSIGYQAKALWVVAGAGAVALILLLGFALGRLLETASAGDSTLGQLGMTRRQLSGLAVARVAIVGVLAAVVAIPVAVGLSPLASIGRARSYEPHPGISADALVLAAAAGLILVAVPLVGWLAARARRVGSASPSALRRWRSRPAEALARAGLPQPLATGVGMAVPGPGLPTTLPARATIAGAIAAVAIATTALTFTASLRHLLGTPRLYGQSWDYALSWVGALPARTISRVRSDPAVTALAVGENKGFTIDGRLVGVDGFDDVKGSVPPTVIDGRAPSTPGEIVLGTKTLHAVHARIGSRVELRNGRRSASMTVVGTGVIAQSTGLSSLGEGAAVTFAGLKRLAPEAQQTRLRLRVAPGPNRERTLERLERTFTQDRPFAPSDVADFGGIDNLPLIVAALFALGAAASLAWNLFVSTRRRRRELAVLKTLGFTRGQVLASVAFQAATVVAVGLLAGVPVGIGAGRWAWRLFASNLGVANETVTPLGATLLVIPATLVLALLVAALPGRSAARTRPALVLRAE